MRGIFGGLAEGVSDRVSFGVSGWLKGHLVGWVAARPGGRPPALGVVCAGAGGAASPHRSTGPLSLIHI